MPGLAVHAAFDLVGGNQIGPHGSKPIRGLTDQPLLAGGFQLEVPGREVNAGAVTRHIGKGIRFADVFRLLVLDYNQFDFMIEFSGRLDRQFDEPLWLLRVLLYFY